MTVLPNTTAKIRHGDFTISPEEAHGWPPRTRVETCTGTEEEAASCGYLANDAFAGGSDDEGRCCDKKVLQGGI